MCIIIDMFSQVTIRYYNYSNLSRIMNEFISPHQNININISYNLGHQDKIPKVVFGKKIAKIVKSTVKDQPKTFYKPFKKSQQPVIQPQQVKKTKSSKKIKAKKNSNHLLAYPDQQQPLPRRLKTQGNLKTQFSSSVVKKQPKSSCKPSSKMATQHFKSVTNYGPNQKSMQIKKPALNASKSKKQQRRSINKSCILYQPKKQFLFSDVQHIVSTLTTGSGPGIIRPQSQPQTSQSMHKKRANSANVIKSDKFINKLLDMSILTSELGGSISMNNNNNNNNNYDHHNGQHRNYQEQYHQNSRNGQNTNNRIKTALQGFMNSVDMRIIQKMEQDNRSKKCMLIDAGIGDGLDLILFLNKIRRIPMDKLNEKAAKIQKFWRKKTGESVIPYYSNMFFRNPAINSKIMIQQNLNQISGIQANNNINEESQIFIDGNIKPLSRKKFEKGELIEFISPAQVSQTSKEQFQEESISAAKIRKMIDKHGSAAQQDSVISDQKEKTGKIQQFQVEEKDINQEQKIQFQKQKANKGNQKLIVKQQQQQKNDSKSSLSSQNSQKNSLNIQKYKQLVRHEIEQNKKQSQKQAKIYQFQQKSQQKSQIQSLLPSQQQSQQQKSSKSLKRQQSGQCAVQQSAHWNHVHNILSTNMNKKVPIMSKTVLQQLMKQSAYNKQWVQGEFSNSQSRKVSQKESPRGDHNREKDKDKDGESKIKPQSNNINQELVQMAHEYQFDRHNSSSQYSEEVQEHEQEEYNWNKYSDISKLKKPQQIVTKSKQKSDGIPMLHHHNEKIGKMAEPAYKPVKKDNTANLQQNNMTVIPGLLPAGIKKGNFYQSLDEDLADQILNQQKNDHNTELQKGSPVSNKDQKWIREQMVMQDGIVEKYLDCGLDYFGLNLNKQSTHNKQINNFTLEQVQQQQVQQKQEHKAKLQKQHNHKPATRSPQQQQAQQIQISKQNLTKQTNQNKNETDLAPFEPKQQQQEKEDDIFSGGVHNSNHDDDMELVYVFNNSAFGQRKQKEKESNNNNNKSHFQAQHAAKNSKRADKADHLRNRQDQPISSTTNQLSLFEPSFRSTQPLNLTAEEQAIQDELNTKRKQKIAESIITKLIEEFAYDVSLILRKSHDEQQNLMNYQRNSIPQNRLNSLQQNRVQGQGPASIAAPSATNIANANIGIQTNFQSVRDFITKIKQFVLADQQICKRFIENLKNNIGPSSMEILSYLRIDQPNQINHNGQGAEGELDLENQDNQEWLFVIPNQLFQVFNKKIMDQEENVKGRKMTKRNKVYTQFWHRSIFECYNQCLDYQRPYGITGAPYSWICQPKLPRPITFSIPKVQQLLQNAQFRLLQLSCTSSGIIFDKPQSPYRDFDIPQSDRLQKNQQNISRMLANQILDDQYNWVTYNDQITELLVDISRKIQEVLVFQVSSDIRKITRRRKMMVHIGNNRNRDRANIEGGEHSSQQEDQHAVFLVQDLM